MGSLSPYLIMVQETGQADMLLMSERMAGLMEVIVFIPVVVATINPTTTFLPYTGYISLCASSSTPEAIHAVEWG